MLRAHNERQPLFDDASYWAPTQAIGIELDFVLRCGRAYLAVEVRHQPRIDGRLLAGLRGIAELPRLARRVLVHRGRQVLRTGDGIDVWPVDRFIEAAATRAL
jgi:hypothetical protein